MKMGVLVLGLILAQSAFAAESPDVRFHRTLISLHETLIKKQPLRLEEENGRYEGSAAAGYRYRDARYFDSTSGRLVSHIKHDADNPKLVHVLEVNVYDAGGRVVRDFASITLPWAPLQPVRTIINLHHYNGQLHSFRQYDVDGEISYESCEGKWDGKPVRIALDAGDINQERSSTSAYKACFEGMEPNWAQYKTPH